MAVIALENPHQFVIELDTAVGQELHPAPFERFPDFLLCPLMRMSDGAPANAPHGVGIQLGRLGEIAGVPVDQFECRADLAGIEH